MTYTDPTYAGDDEYSIRCTGDACVGDEVRFERATFTGGSFGRFRSKPKFAGFETVTGKIVRDSYGADKQQHTFTIEHSDGSTLRIKGRNLYANGTWRKPWADERERHAVLNEKHTRGDRARADREARKAAELGF